MSHAEGGRYLKRTSLKKDKVIKLFKELDNADGIVVLSDAKDKDGPVSNYICQKIYYLIIKNSDFGKTESEFLYVDETPAVVATEKNDLLLSIYPMQEQVAFFNTHPEKMNKKEIIYLYIKRHQKILIIFLMPYL